MNYLEICGIIFHGSLLICALIIIYGTSRALKDKDKRIYALSEKEMKIAEIPNQKELDLISNWDHKDVFNMLDYVAELWNYGDWGFKREWKYDDLFKRQKLHLELHTCGWSGNEDLMRALLDNEWFKRLWYAEWKRGGHYKFIVNPFNIGYKSVVEYCKDNNVSRQYVHKIRDRFDWIIISHNKRLLRPRSVSVASSDVGKCTKCRFNCENNHSVMNDCNVGSYYAEKGLNRICYEGELWEATER